MPQGSQSMPKKDNSSKSTPSLLESAVNSIKEHEKELDRIINRIEKVRGDLSFNFDKTNASIDNIAERIELLDNEIHKLKSVQNPL
jgi:archaellum component FlaC